MAEAEVTLGLDLSAFEASLRSAQEALGKGAARALAQAKVASLEAIRENTRFAREQFRSQQEAAKAAIASEAEKARELRRTEREREQAAAKAIEDARRLAEEERRVGEARAAAAAKLEGMAAGRSEVEKLTFAYKQQVAEISRLAGVSGNNEAAARALSVATQQHQSRLAQLSQSTTQAEAAVGKMTGALQENRAETWKTQQAGMMFRKNIGDIAGSLFYGADALTVFSQQMPDLLQSVGEAGGVGNAAKAAFGGLGSALGAVAPIAAGLAIVIGTLTAAYAVVQNATEAFLPEQYEMARATDAAAAAFARAKAAAMPYGDAMRALQANVRDATEEYGVLIGTMSRVDVEERKALKAAEEKNREALRGIAIQKSAAEQEARLLGEQLRSNSISVETRAEAAKRLKVVREALPALEQQLQAAKQEHAQNLELIRSGAEYTRELQKSNETLDERAKAADRAKAALEAQAESERQVAARLKAIAAALKEMDEANQATIAARREMEAMEVVASDLAALLPELAKMGASLQEAGEALQAEEALGFQRALAEAYKTADQLRGVISLTVRSGLEAAVRAAYKFGEALGGEEFRMLGNLFQNPGQTLGLMTRGLMEAQASAASAVAAAREELQAASDSGDQAAIDEARKNLRDAKRELESATPRGYVQEMMKGATEAVKALVDSAPAMLRELVAQAPKLIQAIVRSIPDLIRALVRSLPTIAVELAVAFAIQLPISLIAEAPAIARALAVGVVGAFVQAAKSIKRIFVDIFREITSFGKRDTRTFGDTPGPVRMDRASTAKFAAGDYVVAARTKEGLRAQTGNQRAESGPPAAITLDLRYGPMRLGLAMAHTELNRREGVGRDSSGRRNPWRR